ncbi:nucleolar protein 4 [[Candida] railenensis]|uniref:Nucleolar protein 4 n=1 Tax=[Candida] railenensis TaxID=45579 RepID=A0A9P0QVY8_9ASCO|nr:nucleolar protein 4 [[Candida] railenensis]
MSSAEISTTESVPQVDATGAAHPKEPSSEDGLDRKTLFVRSVPFEATSEELSEYFSQFAPVKHAVIVNDENQKSRGFGFVSFTMDDDTLLALTEAKTTKFKGRFLRVDIAKRRDRKAERGTGAGISSENPRENKQEIVEKRRARLIIRNLPWSCKKPDVLKKIFSKYGAVFDAYIPKKKGGQMCGFAFVTMKKDSAAKKAIEESAGLKIDGREVAVDLAIEKSKWEERVVEDEEEEDDEDEEEEEDVDEENDEENDEESEEKDDGSFDNLNEINTDDEVEDDDAELKIDEEDEEDEEPEVPRVKANKQEAFSIFVRNIPYDATAETLKEHFERFGTVKYALPVIDKESGLAKGSAFVAFTEESAFADCVDNAPTVASTSMLIADDVSPDYVYDGRILSITSTVDRESASRLAEKNSEKRKEALGKAPGERDKRNLFLLNEGRITENSKLAQFISRTDLELREKSFKLRVQQLNKNPTLHLSLTRLAIRNLPRAMNEKALKALGRKSIVQFATEVKEEKRQGLSKEELTRSVKHKHDTGEFQKAGDDKKKKTKQSGVVKQAKVIMEVKGSGEIGRSRGYGFIEFRDHKCALMGLRWLNAHEVTIPEILEGLTDEEKKIAEFEGLSKRKLIAEFAIENAQVMKRRRDKVFQARSDNSGERSSENRNNHDRKRRRDDRDQSGDANNKKKARKGSSKKGNMNKGGAGAAGSATKSSAPANSNPSGMTDEMKKLIGIKRKRRKGKN